MNAKEALNTIKIMLGMEKETPQADVTEMEFAEATLVDGTLVKTEGEFVEGAQVLVVTEEGDIPAPEGVHQLEDGTLITVDAEGVIVSIEAPAPVEASTETENLEAEVNFSKEDVQKFSSIVSPLMEELAFAKEQANEISSLKEELATLKEAFSAFKNEPAGKKITNNLKENAKVSGSLYEARFAKILEVRKNHNK